MSRGEHKSVLTWHRYKVSTQHATISALGCSGWSWLVLTVRQWYRYKLPLHFVWNPRIITKVGGITHA